MVYSLFTKFDNHLVLYSLQKLRFVRYNHHLRMSETLRFVSLPPFFRAMGKQYIPEAVLQNGYQPEQGPQQVVFGDSESLADWRNRRGLSEEEYPIHEESSMGTHIDIYGEKVARVCNGGPIEDFISFARSRRK